MFVRAPSFHPRLPQRTLAAPLLLRLLHPPRLLRLLLLAAASQTSPSAAFAAAARVATHADRRGGCTSSRVSVLRGRLADSELAADPEVTSAAPLLADHSTPHRPLGLQIHASHPLPPRPPPPRTLRVFYRPPPHPQPPHYHAVAPYTGARTVCHETSHISKPSLPPLSPQHPRR